MGIVMDDSEWRDQTFADSIADTVLAVLERERFFERLDDRFCPRASMERRAECGHSFQISTQILENIGMDQEEIEDVLAVLRSRGGCCDCEVLYNVAKESRLRAEHWKARH